MSTNATSSWNIGGEGGDSFPFDRIGDSVTGTIDSLTEVQQTDLKTGEPKTFDNGQPMMMYRIGLANTNAQRSDEYDDGHRSVYLKGSRKLESQSSLSAVLEAVKAATGGQNLEPGATLTLTYIGDGQQTNRAFSPPKHYAATYVRPSMNIGQAPATQAPAYAPPVQQAPAYAPPSVLPQYQPAALPQQPAPVAQAPAYVPPPVLHAVPSPAPAGPAPLSPEQIQALINAVGPDQVRAMGYAV